MESLNDYNKPHSKKTTYTDFIENISFSLILNWV